MYIIPFITTLPIDVINTGIFNLEIMKKYFMHYCIHLIMKYTPLKLTISLLYLHYDLTTTLYHVIDVMNTGIIDQETMEIIMDEVGVKNGLISFEQFYELVELVNQVNIVNRYLKRV